jgi:hypothetical protein
MRLWTRAPVSNGVEPCAFPPGKLDFSGAALLLDCVPAECRNQSAPGISLLPARR